MSPAPRFEAPAYRPAGKLEGQVALITGGDSGIGRSVAVLFAREGADVALVYLAEEQTDAEESRRQVAEHDRRALLIPGDVRDPAFCRDAVNAAVSEFGRLDVLVNNAAFQKHRGGLGEVSAAQWQKTFRTNTKSLARNLVEQGIRVNCVAPGPVWTPLNPAERAPEEIEDFGAGTPFGRPAQPEEVAPSYVFFASNADSGYITGHVLPLLGGDAIAA